jgi:hypothetical protein
VKPGVLGPVVVGPTGVLVGEDPEPGEPGVVVVPLLGGLVEPVPVGGT